MRTTVTLVAAILAFATLPVAAQSGTCPPPGSSGPTIDEVRRQRPELRGLSNDDLIDMLRREYYPKLSKEEVACRVGAVWSAPKPASEVSGKPQLSGGPVNKSRRILVNKHPIAFSIISPKGWVEGEIVSGNTKVSITSPPGKPFAECNVITLVMRGFAASQDEIDERLIEPLSRKEMEEDLSAMWKNAKIEHLGASMLNGYPARRFVMRHGSNERGWSVQLGLITMVAPNILISAGCGGVGSSVSEARAAFDYWSTEINIFPTTVKFGDLR